MKTRPLPLALLALAICTASHAADRKYQPYVATMACGEARYTLTSRCIDSHDLGSLNECKPQTLAVDHAATTRRFMLPQLSRHDHQRMRASGRSLGDLFVVHWACSDTARGPMATFYYSIGGGSADDGEAWAHYDRTGKLMERESGTALTPKEVEAAERSFKPVPSIMPGSLEPRK